MRKVECYRYMFDAQTRDGQIKTFDVFANSNAEAEETAIWISHFIGALYLANLTRAGKCSF